MTFTLTAVPLSVLNRALDLFDQRSEKTTRTAWIALQTAERRISTEGPYSPFAQAIAEYISLTGPWSKDGEHADESGFALET